MWKLGNRDGVSTLLKAPFGRAVAALSRNTYVLGHVMLADSYKVIYIAVYSKYFFFSVTP